jgi:hypothetical protein
MAAKRILLLDGHCLIAHCWSSGHIKIEGEFTQAADGLEALAAYLKRHRSSLFYLLADLAEESFQLEDVPFVQGADRTALIQRRLGQYFYNTPLSMAISLGRGRDGRRDEKLMFAALTRIETFTPWLDVLREAQARLVGVYSVPLVLVGCAPQMLAENGPVLLVSLTHSGVRQSFFDKGRLLFSRLSQLAGHGIDEVGRTAAAESAKILQYLVAQRLMPRGASLRTLVLAHPGEIPTLRDACRDSNELQFEFIDLVAAARRQGLRDVPGDSTADNLFIHCLATKTPDQQFAPAGERRFFKLWQVRSALTTAGGLVLAGCLLFAGKTGLTLYQLGESIDTTQAVTATETRRYRGILDGLPAINITPDKLRALMSSYDALQKRGPAMEPLLIHLSRALNDTPRIELTRLVWKIGDALDAGQKAAADAGRNSGAAPAPGAAARNWAVLELQAQLPVGLGSDQRAQLDLIESFATRLRDAQTDVRVLSRPFDIESDKSLRSHGERTDAQLADVPKFALRIARPL